MTDSDNLALCLRKAKDSDLLFFYNLKNDPLVLEGSFNQTPILLGGHTEWFNAKLQDRNSYLFVIEHDSSSIGQVRIDIQGSIGEIDVAVSQAYRGKGCAAWGIVFAVERVFAERADVLKVTAHIKPENIGSQKTFKKAGFTNPRLVYFSGNQCIEMAKEHEQPIRSQSYKLDTDALAKATDAKDLEGRLISNTQFSSSNLHDWIFQQFKLNPDDVILELCCGTGAQTEIMSRLASKGTVYAFDVSKAAIAVVNSKDLRNVRSATLDMDELANLPIAINMFDLVFCSYSLYYSRDTKTLIKNIYPLIKPGGRFIVVGPYGDNNKSLWELIREVYPLDPSILFTCDGYMPELVVPACKNLFNKTSITYFENTVTYPTPQNLFDYIAASTVYKKEYENQLKSRIATAFSKEDSFTLIKKAMCLIAEK